MIKELLPDAARFRLDWEIWSGPPEDRAPSGCLSEEWHLTRRQAESRARYLSRRHADCNPCHVTEFDDEGRELNQAVFCEGYLDYREEADAFTS